LTAQAASTVAPGSYPITVTGTGGGVSPAPTVIVTVVVGGFNLTVGSPYASIVHNSSVVIALGTTAANGFSGALNLTVTGLPAGVTAVFTPATITNPALGSSSLRLTSAATTPEGTRIITIAATSATGAVQTATVQLSQH
jgi:hypothetical protein